MHPDKDCQRLGATTPVGRAGPHRRERSDPR
jgi:hypothetical protein